MLTALACTCHSAQAQANEWTWMGGSDTMHQPGVYGMLGEPAAGDIAGARNAMTQWVGKDGTLWMFGGYGYNASFYGINYLNDLWKFDARTNEWTWVSGNSLNDANSVCADLSICGLPAVYGTKGVAAPENVPG